MLQDCRRAAHSGVIVSDDKQTMINRTCPERHRNREAKQCCSILQELEPVTDPQHITERDQEANLLQRSTAQGRERAGSAQDQRTRQMIHETQKSPAAG